MRAVRTFAVLSALALAGCASEDPWMAPRSSWRSAPLPARLDAAPAPPRRPAAASFAPSTSPSTAPSPARSPVAAPAAPTPTSDVARLNAEERRLWDRMMELREAHDRTVALASALGVWERDPSQHRREQAERALAAYKESPAVRKFAAVALGLSLAACNSIGREIRALNEEERELADQIAVLQDARKANIALVSALQQVQRDGGSKSRGAADKARENYDRAISKVP